MHDEQSLIAAFVKRGKRYRYREVLSSPRLRQKFTRQLAHFGDFDPIYRVPIPVTKLGIDEILGELQKRHSPDIVYAISENRSIDGQELPLVDALQQTVGRGLGTVLSCLPRRLMYVETEHERFILERSDPLEKRDYIRFAIVWTHGDARHERGVFHVAAQALEWEKITGTDAQQLREMLAWFDKNLAGPASIGRDKARNGVCWFKTTATEHIERIMEMVRILERNSIQVTKIQSERPGYVIYEDDWQLVADPGRPR